jgi:hypothetical protein
LLRIYHAIRRALAQRVQVVSRKRERFCRSTSADKERSEMTTRLTSPATVLGALGLAGVMVSQAAAQTAPSATTTTTTTTTAPAAAAAPAAPATVTLLAPGMNGPLSFPTNPYSIDVGPLGKWYVDGALTGLVFGQDSRVSGDKSSSADLTNGSVMIQKVDGWWQFYAQAGAYSLPVVGEPYSPGNDSSHTINNYYGAVPMAFLKLVPTDNIFLEFGKLPGLIGAESTFSFENFNIERGLIWNSEPAISRGAEIGYTIGPVAITASLNDGYYSNRYNWITCSVAWTINPTNTLTFAGGGNIGHTSYQETIYATPVQANNSQLYNIIYTYNNAPWTITPYVQLQVVPKNENLGPYNVYKETNAYAGAVLVSYAFNSNFSLGGRVEYLATEGSVADGSANLLYGPGSKALTLSLTPTYQFNRFYIRGEASYVNASSITPGLAFGTDGHATDQVRGLIEGGVLF